MIPSSSRLAGRTFVRLPDRIENLGHEVEDIIGRFDRGLHDREFVATRPCDKIAGTVALRPVRGDALAGLSAVVGELHDGSLKGTLDRLKMCAAEECRRVFFDRSKPATRRWCMSTLCGNRTKTRTYRERHRNAD